MIGVVHDLTTLDVPVPPDGLRAFLGRQLSAVAADGANAEGGRQSRNRQCPSESPFDSRSHDVKMWLTSPQLSNTRGNDFQRSVTAAKACRHST